MENGPLSVLVLVSAQLFYDRLFEIDPDLRPLFRGDIQQQAHRLMATITFAVDGLDDLDMLCLRSKIWE